jgi:hypothetical protein
MQRADVLFTGDSQAMFAFSSSAVGQYFRDHRIRHFLLGFGYREQDWFFLDLMRKYHLRPKMIVVGADPYFAEHRSFMAHDVMRRYIYWRVRAWALKASAALASVLCSGGLRECVGNHTLFRSITDGSWIWKDTLRPDEEKARTAGVGRQYEQESAAMQRSAQKFIEETGLDPSCILVVPLPDGHLWPGPNPLQKIAMNLGMAYVEPVANNLYTVDDVHLSYRSAERWSHALLREFERLSAPCLR